MGGQLWLVTGASGQLGGHLLTTLAADVAARSVLALVGGGTVVATGTEIRRIDLRRAEELRALVLSKRPTHVLHIGALTSPSEAQARPDDCSRINTLATAVLAASAAEVGARLVFSSTDMVFDGKSAPYREDDRPCPISHYGRTKAEAERLLAAYQRTLIIRLPLMYGFPCTARATTFTRQIEALRAAQPLRLFTDEYRTPVWLADAAKAVITLAHSSLTGVIHVAGPQRLSRFEMVVSFARLLGIREPALVAASRLSIDSAEERPEDLSLDSSRFNDLFPDAVAGPIRPEVFEGEK